MCWMDSNSPGFEPDRLLESQKPLLIIDHFHRRKNLKNSGVDLLRTHYDLDLDPGRPVVYQNLSTLFLLVEKIAPRFSSVISLLFPEMIWKCARVPAIFLPRLVDKFSIHLMSMRWMHATAPKHAARFSGSPRLDTSLQIKRRELKKEKKKRKKGDVASSGSNFPAYILMNSSSLGTWEWDVLAEIHYYTYIYILFCGFCRYIVNYYMISKF